jgi:hypothetical protein
MIKAKEQQMLKGALGPVIPNSLNPIHGVTSAAHDVTGFISALTEPNTWIRIAEVTVGAIMLAVGISAMLKVPVGGIAKKAAETAAVA